MTPQVKKRDKYKNKRKFEIKILNSTPNQEKKETICKHDIKNGSTLFYA